MKSYGDTVHQTSEKELVYTRENPLTYETYSFDFAFSV